MAGAAGSVSGTPSAFVPDEQSVEQLINFGFTRAQCVKALKCTTGNMERAADWLFNHPNDNGNYSFQMQLILISKTCLQYFYVNYIIITNL